MNLSTAPRSPRATRHPTSASFVPALSLAALLVGSTAPAVAAPAPAPVSATPAVQSMAYVPQVDNWYLAWLVDWLPNHRAHVVNFAGRGDGSWTQDPATGQRVITLDTPVSYTQAVPDCTGAATFVQRVDLTQLAITERPGTLRRGSAAVAEIGRFVDLGGCTPGLVTPVGSTADPGIESDRLSMAARPATDDLVPGAQLAGFSETPWIHPLADNLLAQDVATFGAGTLSFQGTGHVASTSASLGWMVMDTGAFRRGYTRFRADGHGEEVWLAATWGADGTPENVWRVFMVKPRAGATFGGVARAAHTWESGLLKNSTTPFREDLYRDGTGLRRQENLVSGTETDSPVTRWWLSGNDLLQDRPLGTAMRERTWVPVATIGSRHWVLETEVEIAPDGSTKVAIPQRVNAYYDEGPAPRPVARRND